MKTIFIDFKPNIHAENFYNAFNKYFNCELYFWQILSIEEKNDIKKKLKTYDLLFCADIFHLEDLIWNTEIKKICVSWTSDIVEMQNQEIINLDEIFELLIVDCSFVENLWKKAGLVKTKIFQMPYGIETKKNFEYSARVRKNIISTRSWYQNYNQKILLEAILLSDNFNSDDEFHFAGEGPTLNYLKVAYESIQSKNFVKYLGKLPHKTIVEVISSYKLYISTSLSDGISVSMLEAMAAGTPVLVSDIEPNRELITHGINGFLFANNSIIDLSLKIKDIFANSYDLEFISQQANLTVREKANWELNLKNLISIIHTI